VYSFSGWPVSYDLQANLPIQGELSPDPDDSNGNSNNTLQTATSIAEPGPRPGRTIHSNSDMDFYTFQMSTPGTAEHFVGITFRHTQGDLDINLLDPAGNILASSAGVGDSERISLQDRPAGTYYLRVYGFGSATGTYDAQFSFPRTAGDRFEPNNTPLTATDIRSQRIVSDLSIHNNSDQDYFQFTLPAGAGATHSVTMNMLPGSGDLDLQLYNSAVVLVGSSTGVGSTENISLSGLPGGDYFIRAYGYNGSTGSHRHCRHSVRNPFQSNNPQ